MLLKSFAGTRTVVLSTHSLTEANALCYRVLVLHQGRILAQGTPYELFPEHPVSLTPEEIFVRLLDTSRTKMHAPTAAG